MKIEDLIELIGAVAYSKDRRNPFINKFEQMDEKIEKLRTIVIKQKMETEKRLQRIINNNNKFEKFNNKEYVIDFEPVQTQRPGFSFSKKTKKNKIKKSKE